MGWSWAARSRRSWAARSCPLVAILKQHGTISSAPPLTGGFTKRSAGLLSLVLPCPIARTTCEADRRINPASRSLCSHAAAACLGAAAAFAYFMLPFGFEKDCPERYTGAPSKSTHQHYLDSRRRLNFTCWPSLSCHCESFEQVTMSSKGLQECGASILVYVLDCSSSRRQNHGAAKAILKELNVHQDFYELRSRAEIKSTFPFKPGVIETMLVANDHVLLVGLRSTAFGGMPEECGDESGKIKFTSRNPDLPLWALSLQDTSADRKQRFAECLTQLASGLDALHDDIINPNNEIAFHYNMGCANAGGKWEEYQAMIQDFAKTVAVEYGKKYRVAIYGCPFNES